MAAEIHAIGPRPRPERDARLAAAVVMGQIAAILSRRLGRGGGTTLPGQVTSLIDPGALAKIAAGLPDGSVVITGTNGKTTTARLIAAMLTSSGKRVVHNRSGANLFNGVASALVRATRAGGSVCGDLGVFEVDEASVPEVVQAVRPRVLAINNLFRDQLDRYGEVTYVAAAWRRAVEASPESTTLVLNADDPNVAALGRSARGRVLYVGVDDTSAAGNALEHTADARLCPVCGERLEYPAVYYAHIGHYRCPSCSFRRPAPDLAAATVSTRGAEGSSATIRTPGGDLALNVPLAGVYNVYNSLLALGVAESIGLSLADAASVIARFTAAFGRIERVRLPNGGGRSLVLTLIKNPIGFNQVARALLSGVSDAEVLIAINDNLADGTDVSWLWDADVEPIAASARRTVVTGTRAHDMRLRLKYGGVDHDRVELAESLVGALDRALAGLPDGGTLYVLPTYTAMLDLRAELVRRGLVAPFWED